MAAPTDSTLIASSSPTDDPPMYGASRWWVAAHDVASGLTDVVNDREIVPRFFNPITLNRMREFFALVLREVLPSDVSNGTPASIVRLQAIEAADTALRQHPGYIESPTPINCERLLMELEQLLLQLTQRRTLITDTEVQKFRELEHFCQNLGDDGEIESMCGITCRD